MTLLIAALAAATVTIIWYTSEKARKLKVGALCYMFWGASLMWLVDAVFEYSELRAEYFEPSISDIANDTFLGLSVVVLALVIWILIVLIKDPMGVVKSSKRAEA